MMGNEDEDGTIRSKRPEGPSREKRGKNLAKSELRWPQREVTPQRGWFWVHGSLPKSPASSGSLQEKFKKRDEEESAREGVINLCSSQTTPKLKHGPASPESRQHGPAPSCLWLHAEHPARL